MDYQAAELSVVNWGKRNSDVVQSVYVVGSHGIGPKEARKTNKSDLDLMIFVRNADDQVQWFGDMAAIGLDTGVLIHPIFIEESERDAKLAIKLYSDAFARGRKVFPKANTEQ